MAKFFWNYLRIKPRFMPERLSPIEEALVWQVGLLSEKINALTAQYGKAVNPFYARMEWHEYFQEFLRIKSRTKSLEVPNIGNAGLVPNFILFAEHSSVYSFPKQDEVTLNDPIKRETLLKPGVTLENLPAAWHCLPIEHAARSITYHGPGQLTCYLIVDLEDAGINSTGISMPVDINRVIERAVKEVLARLDIKGYTLPELIALDDPNIQKELLLQGAAKQNAENNYTDVGAARGIWVVVDNMPKKIMSRGVKTFIQKYSGGTARTFTLFGFALNISTDLSYFDYINPCGLPLKITSVEKITGRKHSLPKVAKLLADALVEKFREISGDNSHELI